MARHPIQPLETDERGVLRFKKNAIVLHLLDNGGIDLNDIARSGFSREDHEQFAQLIGYSHSGASELSYFSDETWYAAEAIQEGEGSDTQVRLDTALGQLKQLREALREPMAQLFRVHPDDLSNDT